MKLPSWVEKRELSGYAFTKYGNDAKLYNSIHDLETALIESLTRRAIPKRRTNPRRGRVKDREYLGWIASQPCCVPTCKSKHLHKWQEVAGSRTEAAHVGARGLAQKCSDRETIPLCAWHHRTGDHSHHVLGKKFWDEHGLDRDRLIEEFNARFQQEKEQGK